MKNTLLKQILLVVAFSLNSLFTLAEEYSAYLFAYFKGEGLAQGEQIYFAISRDGLNWKDLNDGNPVLTSTLGEKGLRDPFIMRSAEGDKFFVIATDLKIYGNGNWSAAQTSGSKSIMVWESSDLINWSSQRMCRVAPDGAGCTWAPEAVYDDETGEYIVFWSSKIPSGDNTHRVYYCTTPDFKTFSSPKVWIELKNQSGRVISTIDATAIKVGNTYYRFKKNEATEAHKYGMPSSGKYIILEKSNSLLGEWKEIDSEMSKISGVEGPTCFKFNNENKWCLLIDDFGGKGYYPLVTDDLSSGKFTQLSSNQYSFPSVMRHGSVINITESEYKQLMRRYMPDYCETVARVNPALRQQTMEGWGVSLCWWANMCGKWTDDKVDFLVNLLTSEDNANYNIFRYNIGGGDDPSHINGHMCSGKGKRAEMDGFKASQYAQYNWNADAGQRKIMLKIKEVRPDAIFEAFSNSPPYWMTYSGCASGNKTATDDNLKPEYYDQFCDYLIDVCKHYKDEYGIEFKTLDPFNEPNTNYWGANGGQEGCHFSPSSQVKLIRKLYPKLKNSGLATVISACDETNVGTAIGELQTYIKEGDIIPMLGQFNVHTYGGNRMDKANLKDLVNQSGLPFWMSETGAGGSGIEGNLSLAQRMFDDLNYLMPQAWIDWQFVEEGNDQWCLVQGNFSKQTYNIVKNFYIRMQVTRFIKQGYTLLATGRDDLLVAESPNGDEVVIVMLNTSKEQKSVTIDLSLLKDVSTTAQLYVTNSSKNCEKQKDLEIEDETLSYVMGGLEIATAIVKKRATSGVVPFEEDYPYMIVARGASQTLQSNGSEVVINPFNISDFSQQWYFKKLSSGNYVIYTFKGDEKFALLNDGSYYLTTAELNETDKNQQFKIESIGENCFKISSLTNDKMLDLEGGSSNAGTKVGLWQADVAGADAHREWRILSLPFSKTNVNETSVVSPSSETPVYVFTNENTIHILIAVEGDYAITIYDASGRVVSTMNGKGIDECEFSAKAGVYTVRCVVGGEVNTAKVVVK